jgi:tRNA nucleotidyltransferase (CCA-adding enzyme)
MRRPEDAMQALRQVPGAAPALDAVAAEPSAWVVGGSVRDALLGRVPTELDVVVAGDPATLVARLGEAVDAHERFGTATVVLPEGTRVDVVRARAETYAHPGALPDVRPGTLEDDLARRDFTVNAIAGRPGGELRSVPGALEDLRAGRIRVLHDASFVDDATRLWRAGRYAARLGFDIDEGTRVLAALADPTTVSGPRHGAELRRTLREDDPLTALRRIRELNERLLPPGFTTTPTKLDEALALLPDGEARPDLVVLAACSGPVDVMALLAWLDHLGFSSAEREIVAAGSRASTGAPLHRARTNAEVARAARGAPIEVVALAGGDAARRWIEELRHVKLGITGDDLLAAGIAPGPELGERLQRTLDRKLDGEVAGREEELAAALEDDTA